MQVATAANQLVRAETQRQVRGTDISSGHADQVVGWIIDDVLERLSVNLTPDPDPISDPDELRRSDGTSVYRHSGRDMFTSPRILDAEQRITIAAGRGDGRTVRPGSLYSQMTVLPVI